MSRCLVALLGSFLLAGCGSAPAPLAPDAEWPSPPPPPVVIEEPIAAAAPNDDDTRQSALRVMASEQRTLLSTLESESRFARVSTSTQQRIVSALDTTHRELSGIERSIAELDRNDSISLSDRRERHDELKIRLRRLATRLSLLENAVRER